MTARKRAKSVTIQMRINKNDKIFLEQTARTLGVSMSSLIRQAAVNSARLILGKKP